MTVTLLQDHPRFRRSELAKKLPDHETPGANPGGAQGTATVVAQDEKPAADATPDLRRFEKANLHGLHRDIDEAQARSHTQTQRAAPTTLPMLPTLPTPVVDADHERHSIEIDTRWFFTEIINPLAPREDLLGSILGMVRRVSVVDAVAAKGGLKIGPDEEFISTREREGSGDAPTTRKKDLLTTLSGRLFRAIFNEVHAGRANNARVMATHAMQAAIQDNFLRSLRQDESATPEQIQAIEKMSPAQMIGALTNIMPVEQEIRQIVAPAIRVNRLSLVPAGEGEAAQAKVPAEAPSGPANTLSRPQAQSVLSSTPANPGMTTKSSKPTPTLH